MANARLYSINSEVIPQSEMAKLKGQAKIVMDVLLENKTPRLATAITEDTTPRLKTRQDFLRVTLYYIIVFKSKGWIHVKENKTQSEEVTQSETV